MTDKKTAPKKLPQEVMNAQYRLDHAIVRGIDGPELEQLRDEVREIYRKNGLNYGLVR